jgi:hypothetical protein
MQDLNLGLTTVVDGATTTQITLDTSKPGEHTIRYTVTDSKGLTGSATCTVIVNAPKAANDNPQPQGAEQSSHGNHATTTPIVATSTPPFAPAANDNQAPSKPATTSAASSFVRDTFSPIVVVGAEVLTEALAVHAS